MWDLLLNKDNELRMELGDFVVGESKEQHIALIIDSSAGAWKQNPLLGVGIRRNVSMPFNRNAFLKGTIIKHLEYDNLEVDNIDILEDKINIY